LNILFVSDVSIQNGIDFGGAERVLYEQTTRLAARGHDVHILTRRLPAHKADCEVIENVREWRYQVNQNNAISFFVSTLRNGKRLFETISNATNFDCINFHQPFSAFCVMLSGSYKKTRTVYTCHSLSSEEYASRNSQPSFFLKRIVYLLHQLSRRWIEKQVVCHSDRIIVLSQFTHDKLTDIHKASPENIVVIPGGVDLTRFHPAGDVKRVQESLDLPRNKMILLTVRNLEPRMGIENLIQAMPAIVKSLPNIYLIIGGTGPLKRDLEMMSRRLNLDPYIHFAGFIPEATLPEYYRAVDLFILPTIELEGFGLVTVEALASGTPVLGTPVGGTQEILARLEDGRFLFQNTSSEAIAGLITETCRGYLDHPDRWHLDSRRCRQYAEQHYSWETNVDATERLFLGGTF
jgi:glycosyltransferase involved in cell wall biosynthesis